MQKLSNSLLTISLVLQLMSACTRESLQSRICRTRTNQTTRAGRRLRSTTVTLLGCRSKQRAIASTNFELAFVRKLREALFDDGLNDCFNLARRFSSQRRACFKILAEPLAGHVGRPDDSCYPVDDYDFEMQ